MSNINRRDFLKIGVTAGSFLALSGSSDIVTRVFGKTETPQKIIIQSLSKPGWMRESFLPSGNFKARELSPPCEPVPPPRALLPGQTLRLE